MKVLSFLTTIYFFGEILFVLICRGSRLHICSLSSGKAHPLAEHSEFVAVQQKGRYGMDINYSRACGDYVAARVDFGHISVWNWKTGEHLSHKVCTFARYPS